MTQLQPDRVFQMLQVFIRHQYVANADTTLRQIRDLDSESYQLNPDLKVFAHHERESILRILRSEITDTHSPDQQGLVHLFLISTEEFIYRNNQFVTISPEEQQDLARVYIAFIEDTIDALSQATDIAETGRLLWAVQERHFLTLQAFIVQLGERNSSQGRSVLYRRAVCEEYPARLQLQILGIDRQALLEPVLDVGCGKGGALVAALRRGGIAAYGIDRLATPSRYLVAVDWLAFRFQEARWGTIISHMAFSNHFIFQHLYRDGRPEIYAQKYMEILGALKTGGVLCYTPGLPFIERYLPAARFRVLRREIPISEQAAMDSVAMYCASLGENALYAARVVRIA